MQQDVSSIGQLTTCLYELMREVKTIKNDLKRVKTKKGFLSVRSLLAQEQDTQTQSSA